MNYKIIWWSFLFLIYVAWFWVVPFNFSEGGGVLGVFTCHAVGITILAFAWLVGFLYEKAYG